MRSCIFVRQLNKSGNYKSALDHENAFKDSKNPEGLFRVVVQPIKNWNDENVIQYAKVKGGYFVLGEGYIICEPSEEAIDKYIRDNFSDKWENLVHKENTKIVKDWGLGKNVL